MKRKRKSIRFTKALIGELELTNSCVSQYWLAHYYYYKVKETSKAKYYIDKALRLYNTNGVNISYAFDSVEVLSLYNQFKEKNLFGLAGTIYSMFSPSLYDISLDSFKHYFYLLQNNIPNEINAVGDVILYSFRSTTKYNKSDITNNTLNMARPTTMNDPFDSIAYIWNDLEHLKEIVKDPSHLSVFVKAFEYFRIRSFITSSKPGLRYKEDDTILEDILMWSHYAESHKGMCVKYRLTPEYFSFRTDNNGTYHYRELRPIKYVKKDKLKKTVRGINTQRAFFQKSAFWEKENEVRLLSFNTQEDGPYFQEPLDNGAAVVEIIFGYKSTKRFRNSIIKSVKGKSIIFSFMDMVKYDNVYKLIKRPL